MNNWNEYSDAMDEFTLKTASLRDDGSSVFIQAVEDVCRTLGIARIEIQSQSNTPVRTGAPDTAQVLFTKKEYNEEDVFILQDLMNGGNPFIFRFYPEKDAPKWNDEYLKRITVFQKRIRLIKTRITTINRIDEYVFKERELGIYNHAFFMHELNKLIEQGKAGGYCAVFFNMQRYSSVNLQIGRARGSDLLRRYVRMLQSKLGNGEYVCRVGGDNFTALFRDEHVPDVVEHLRGVHMVYNEDTGESILLSAYGGFYKIPFDCKLAPEVMDNIGTALHQARRDKEKSLIFYDQDLVAKIEHKKMIENLFPQALENEEFLVFYQPKIKLDDENKMIGAEALCRWKQKNKLLPPAAFIPILEQTNAICKLDFYMLEHVCRDIRRWLDEGREIVKVSVNISRRHLGTSYFLDNLIQIINMYDIPREYVEIEFTETSTEVDHSDLESVVAGLHEAGISTSVDDFGVGYSSMNMLRDLPWDVLKIDKSFLPENETANKKQFIMLKHLISMAEELGLECVVEGVETEEQAKLLLDNNCFLAQGFYFSEPLPVNVFEERME